MAKNTKLDKLNAKYGLATSYGAAGDGTGKNTATTRKAIDKLNEKYGVYDMTRGRDKHLAPGVSSAEETHQRVALDNADKFASATLPALNIPTREDAQARVAALKAKQLQRADSFIRSEEPKKQYLALRKAEIDRKNDFEAKKAAYNATHTPSELSNDMSKMKTPVTLNGIKNSLNDPTTIGGAFSDAMAQGMSAQSIAKVIDKIESKSGVQSPDGRTISQTAAERFAKGQTAHPKASAAGNVAGGLAKMLTIGGATGSIGGAGVAGRAISGAATGAVDSVINNIGDLVQGDQTAKDFAKNVLVEAGAMGAGGAAGAAIGKGISGELIKRNMQTPFAEFVRQVVSGTGSAGARVGVNYVANMKVTDAFRNQYLASNPAATEDEIQSAYTKALNRRAAVDMAVSFAFSVISGYQSTLESTKQGAASIKGEYEKMMSKFDAIRKNPAASNVQELADDVLASCNSIKAELNSTYYAGQQNMVNQINEMLDSVIKGTNEYMSNLNTQVPSVVTNIPVVDIPVIEQNVTPGETTGIAPVASIPVEQTPVSDAIPASITAPVAEQITAPTDDLIFIDDGQPTEYQTNIDNLSKQIETAAAIGSPAKISKDVTDLIREITPFTHMGANTMKKRIEAIYQAAVEHDAKKMYDLKESLLDEIVSEQYNNEDVARWKEFKGILRSMKLKPSNALKAEIGGAKDFKNWKNKNFNNGIRISNDGLDMDRYYTTLNEWEPYTFPEDLGDIDRFNRLREAIEELRPKATFDYLNGESVDEWRKDISDIITDEYFGKGVLRYETQNEVKEQKSEVKQSRGANADEWTAERVGNEKGAKSLEDIIAKMSHDFDVNITSGYVKGQRTRGNYNLKTKGIRIKRANDLPVASHELGHALDQKYGLLNNLSDGETAELEKAFGKLSGAGYKKSDVPSEGFAEYLRRYLQNSKKTASDYPLITDRLLKSLSPTDLVRIEQLADDVNAYYAEAETTARGSIRNREKGVEDFRTFGEKARDIKDAVYTAMVDSNHRIRQLDKELGGNAHTLASNAAYSDAVAGRIILDDLTDINGKYVGQGLNGALEGVNTRNKVEYADFNEYLICKHGIERLKAGKDIFANEVQNDPEWMSNRITALEEKYPRFKKASEQLYQFEDELMQTWAVDTGIISQKTLDTWRAKYKYHVPLYRAKTKGGGQMGARRGYANQSSPFKGAKGGTGTITSPVDNIIDDIVRLVNIAKRNTVMQAIRKAALNGDNATFMERVDKTKVSEANIKGLKSSIKDELAKNLSGSVSADTLNSIDDVIDGFDDILKQYSKGGATKNGEITVLVNGEKEVWKINDELLYKAITNLNTDKLSGFAAGYAATTRFLTSNITGNNIVWSIFSNAPRDFMTYLTYTPVRNPGRVLSSWGSTYANAIGKGSAESASYYKEYLALGGGKDSAYSADIDLAKKARNSFNKTTKDKVASYLKNPFASTIDAVSFVSDTIEMGPRFATYKMCRENGMSEQEAFYMSTDVTTNFRRGGYVSRQVNHYIPFFNAAVQGTDKLARFVTAEDITSGSRAKVAACRVGAILAASAALGAMVYAINNKDEESRKNYNQLSSYTKNSYFVFPQGDGKFFAVTKPRELGTAISAMERVLESSKNKHAFDSFGQYISNNFLPSVASDIASAPIDIAEGKPLANVVTDNAVTALGSFGIVGVAASTLMNRDFLGRSIVSTALQDYVPEEQYTNASSKLAVAIGKALKLSPAKIDYIGKQTVSYLWKAQQAIFPVGKDKQDLTLGVKNTYNKDYQYSNDIVNWLYDRKSQTSLKSANKTIDEDIAAKNDANMSGFYSRFYGLTKTEPETALLRKTKGAVLDRLFDYRDEVESGKQTDSEKKLYSVVKATKDTSLMPSVMDTFVKGDNAKHELKYNEYYEFQELYNTLYWGFIDKMDDDLTDVQKAEYIDNTKDLALKTAKNVMLSKFNDADKIKAKGIDANTIYKYLVDGATPTLEDVPDIGYKSSDALKKGIGSADYAEDWHHIVEQEQKKLPVEKIQNSRNVVSIQGGADSVHTLVTKYYQSTQDFTDGKRVNEWLSDKSFEEQWQFGVDYLSRYGQMIPAKDCWYFVPYSSKQIKQAIDDLDTNVIKSSDNFREWTKKGYSEEEYLKGYKEVSEAKDKGNQSEVIEYLKKNVERNKWRYYWKMLDYKSDVYEAVNSYDKKLKKK